VSRAATFEHFDAKVADRLVAASDAVTGLPKYLGIRLVEFGPGRLVAEMAVRDELKTPFGNLHGGVMAGLVDHVLGVVAYPLMRRGQWAATTEFKLNYLAPVSGGTLRAESQVVSMTRTTAIVRVEVSNGERMACIAQGTLLLRDPKPADS
jgi:uncharacterized protein (TIGR00369 family)